MSFDLGLDPVAEIDWLLTSGQVSRAVLAESLVRLFYEPVYRWSYFLHGDQDLAEAAALQTFGEAVSGLSTYFPGLSPRAWLLDLAYQTYQSEPARPTTGHLSALPERNATETALLRAFQWLDWESRLLLFLHHALRLSPSECGRPLGMTGGEAVRRLDQGCQKLLGILPRLGNTAVDLDSHLPAVLSLAYPSTRLSEESLPGLAARVESLARRLAARRNRASMIRETAWIAVAILAVLALTYWMNQAFPDEPPHQAPIAAGMRSPPQAEAPPHTNVVYLVRPGDSLQSIAARVEMPVADLMTLNILTSTATLYPGQALFITAGSFQGGGSPGQETRREQSEGRLLKPDSSPAGTGQEQSEGDLPDLAPSPAGTGQEQSKGRALTAASSPVEIRRRFQESSTLWQTLWADIEAAPYGSLEGTSFHDLDRYQVWISQPDLGLEISGPADELPYFRRLTSAGKRYYSAGSAIMYFDPTWPGDATQLVSSSLLRSLVFPGANGWDPAGGDFHLLGSAEVAGRSALAVDWVSSSGQVQAHLWLDARTGILLRQQKISSRAPGEIVSEVIVGAIAFDIPLPARVFNPEIPWQGSFAPDYHGPATRP